MKGKIKRQKNDKKQTKEVWMMLARDGSDCIQRFSRSANVKIHLTNLFYQFSN